MKKYIFSIFGIFIFFLVLRTSPYLFNSVPLGYDSGIYAYLFRLFPHIPLWQLTGFAPGLFTFFYPFIVFGINPEFFLIPLSYFSQILLFLSIYFVSKKLQGEKVAFFTSFLFTVSLVQFRNFWFFYLNNTFALVFLLFAFYFLARKKTFLSIFFGTMLGFFHLPTFFIYNITLLILSLWERKDIFCYLRIFFCVLLICSLYYIPIFRISLLPYIRPMIESIGPYQIFSGKTVQVGTFYSPFISFFMTALYLPFSFIGLYISRKSKHLKPFLIGFCVLFIIVITHFFFSRRYFISLDIFLIFFAGIGLQNMLERYKHHKDFFFLYFFLLIFSICAFIFKTGQPIVSPKLFQEIRSLNTIQGAYILSTSKEDNAWLLGYTSLQLIAWSYGENDKYWTREEWQDFFSSISLEKKLDLLNKLPKPLYIFMRDTQQETLQEVTSSSCVQKITDHTYLYVCNKE